MKKVVNFAVDFYAKSIFDLVSNGNKDYSLKDQIRLLTPILINYTFHFEKPDKSEFIYKNLAKYNKKIFKINLDYTVDYIMKHQYFWHKISDITNNFNMIKAVLIGWTYSGGWNSYRVPTMLVYDGNDVHYFQDTPVKSNVGIIGLIHSSIQEKKHPFTHRIYDKNIVKSSFTVGRTFDGVKISVNYGEARFLDVSMFNVIKTMAINFYNKLESDNGY